MASLLKLNAALTYEDFAGALEVFLAASMPFCSHQINIGALDHNHSNYSLMLVRGPRRPSPAAQFQPWDLRKFYTESHEEWLRRHPGLNVTHTHSNMREWLRSGWFSHLAEPEQWSDNLSATFRVNGNIHSGFWIKRGLDDAPFSTAEVRFIERYYPWLKAAFERVRLLEDARARNLDVSASLFDIPVATFLLDWDFALQQHNAAAALACAAWTLGPERARAVKPPAMSAAVVPDEIRAACAALREHWLDAALCFDGGDLARTADTGARNAWRASIAHSAHPRLEATVTLLRPGVQRLAHPSFLVRVTDAGPAAIAAAAADGGSRRVQLLARLSQAERALVPMLMKGCTDKEIAVALGKSVPTVKKQARSIYEKLRVSNRARLVALLR